LTIRNNHILIEAAFETKRKADMKNRLPFCNAECFPNFKYEIYYEDTAWILKFAKANTGPEILTAFLHWAGI